MWGDTVNTASRLESQGLVGRIRVTEEAFQHIQGWCRCEPRGVIEVKGKGPMNTHLVVSPAGSERSRFEGSLA